MPGADAACLVLLLARSADQYRPTLHHNHGVDSPLQVPRFVTGMVREKLNFRKQTSKVRLTASNVADVDIAAQPVKCTIALQEHT